MKEADAKEVAKRFGEFIKSARTNKKLTQKEVAEAIGVSQTYVYFLEQGDRNVDLSLALTLCQFLGCDLNDFVSTIQ